jgi:type I restriction enzyme S subunit
MSFPRYESYKDSGVEWLGEVPKHWDVKRLKHNMRLLTEKTNRRENPVALENIESWSGRFIQTETSFEGEGVAFENGDILFGKLRPYLAKAYLAEATGEAVGDFHVMRPTKNSVGRFAQYQILNREFISIVDGSTFGAKMPRASWEFMSNMVLATPSIPEQQTIATFLDRETSKIDALITEQQRLIELLKEKRQAIISHAITKGINPDAPMKDSEIEWLGEVPAHWEMKRLKNISPFIAVGIVVNPSEYVSDDGLPFIYGGDISEGAIDFDNSRRITEADSFRNKKTRLVSGDLLTVRVGAPGITAVVPEECNGGNCASVMLIRKGHFDSHWLCYAMNSRMVRFQVEIVQYGAAQEQFNISHAINFWIATPHKEEQSTIVAFLDRETAKLDDLTAAAQRAITLLQERRSALISAAVTGKIDVRGIVAALPQTEVAA